MLVLTRKANQSIVIGKDIVITILDVHRDQIRIGIDAPREVDVHRLEVFEALEKANQEASESSPTPSATLVPSAERLAT